MLIPVSGSSRASRLTRLSSWKGLSMHCVIFWRLMMLILKMLMLPTLLSSTTRSCCSWAASKPSLVISSLSHWSAHIYHQFIMQRPIRSLRRQQKHINVTRNIFTTNAIGNGKIKTNRGRMIVLVELSLSQICQQILVRASPTSRQCQDFEHLCDVPCRSAASHCLKLSKIKDWRPMLLLKFN